MNRPRFFPQGLSAGALLVLAACSSPNEQPGAVTADEAHQLNEAAAMLDANSVDLNAVAPDATEADTLPANESEAR